eukprot:150539_1
MFTFYVIASLLVDIYVRHTMATDYAIYVVTPMNGSFILHSEDRIITTAGAGITYLVMDGNLTLYQQDDNGANRDLKWSCGIKAEGSYAEINSEGNIMVKDTSHNVRWESNTDAQSTAPPYSLVVAYQCVYLMDIQNTVLWTQGSGCHANMPTIHPPPSHAPTLGPTSLTSLNNSNSIAPSVLRENDASDTDSIVDWFPKWVWITMICVSICLCCGVCTLCTINALCVILPKRRKSMRAQEPTEVIELNLKRMLSGKSQTNIKIQQRERGGEKSVCIEWENIDVGLAPPGLDEHEDNKDEDDNYGLRKCGL